MSKAMQSGADKLMKKWEATKGMHAEVPESAKLPNDLIAPDRKLPNPTYASRKPREFSVLLSLSF